jgi:hypothetical protein
MRKLVVLDKLQESEIISDQFCEIGQTDADRINQTTIGKPLEDPAK